MVILTGKTIGEVTQIIDIPIDALFLIEHSGITYNTPYSSVQNYRKIISTDDVIYTGANINCLNIKENMDLTEIIENIGDIFCRVTPSNILCYEMLFPQPSSGSCQNSLEYMFNQSISSWCVDNPLIIPCTNGTNALDYIFDQSITSFYESNPLMIPCTNGTNSLDYIFDQSITSFYESNPIIIPCTNGTNALGYIFNQSITSFNESNPIFTPCTDGLNALSYFLNQSIDNYKPFVPFELCNDGVNPLERIFNTSIMMFENEN